MIAHHNLNSLIHNLTDLYHKLGLSLYNIRRSFFREPRTNKAYNFHSTLSKQINKLNEKSKNNLHKIQTQPKDYVESKKKLSDTEKNYDFVATTGIHTHVDHNKFKKSPVKCNPTVREQLAKNTWTHIHAAIRNARQGKKTEAKLYGQLANNALKEATHYMSEQEYLNFTAEIDKELNKIKN